MAILAPLPGSFGRAEGRRFSRRRWLALFALAAVTAGAQRICGQVVSRENQIKAVLLYNLTQFVEWPESAFLTDQAPLVIGVLGADNFGTLLDDAIRGEKSNHRPIVVKRFRTVQEAKNCQILFISSSEKDNLRRILPQLKGRPILTVADLEDFIRAGGLIHFFKNPENKIRLKINAEAAKASGLAVSAKLLRVAEIVRLQEE